MARAPGEIAQQVSEAVQGDDQAIQEITQAIQSRDQQRIKTVLQQTAGVEVTDEEIENALSETDEVTAYWPT